MLPPHIFFCPEDEDATLVLTNSDTQTHLNGEKSDFQEQIGLCYECLLPKS
jgi:hypothetical protein